MQLKKLVRLHVVLHTLATLRRSMYVTRIFLDAFPLVLIYIFQIGYTH